MAMVGLAAIGLVSWVSQPVLASGAVGHTLAEPGAEGDPSGTTSTVPDSSTTSTSEPSGGTTSSSSSTSTSSTTTTTLVSPPVSLPPVTIPPEFALDPRAPILFNPGPDDGGEPPRNQPHFENVGNQVLMEKVLEYKAELENRQRALGELEGLMLEQRDLVQAIAAELDGLSSTIQQNVVEAAKAEEELRSHTVEAFITGSADGLLALIRFDDPVQLGVAREMLGSVVQTDREVVRRYKEAKAKLDGEHEDLAHNLSEARTELKNTQEAFTAEVQAIASAAAAVRAYESGSQIYVRGFVFPVDGETEFIDSWGYARMSGTASAHWHQGTDVFAREGTPLVAAETGVLFRVGQASLGGNKLWVRGDSGVEYYYAHLSAFADGMTDGKRVNAGDVVGFVGDTGNARGTSPHLHFEIHKDGSPINPYPLLKATYGTKPMVEIVVAPEIQANLPVLAEPAPAAPVPAEPGP